MRPIVAVASGQTAPAVVKQLDKNHADKTATVVGAGPAGLNMAILLANRGYKVQVYDKRQLKSAQSKRTYVISISPRGSKPMIDAGIRIPQQGQRVSGLAAGSCLEYQAPDGTFTERRILPPTQFFCERQALIEHMVSEAQRLHPSVISIHFDHSLQAIDFDRKQATFTSTSGETVTADYDLLVGADGINSATRSQLQRVEPQLQVEKYDNVRSLRIFAGLPMPASLMLGDESGSYLRFMEGKVEPTNLLLWTNPQGTLSGTLYSSTTVMQTLHTAAEHAAFIRDNIPQYPDELVNETAEQLEQSPLSVGSASVRCSQFHGPSTVLLGDAAHGVTPAMGQGATSSLESTGVFAEVLDECNGDIQRAVELFTVRRAPEVHALFAMDRTADRRQGGEGKANLAYVGNTFHIVKGMLLHKLAPDVFTMPTYLRMMFGEASYRQAHAALNRDRVIVGSILSTVVAVAIAGAANLTSSVLR